MEYYLVVTAHVLGIMHNFSLNNCTVLDIFEGRVNSIVRTGVYRYERKVGDWAWLGKEMSHSSVLKVILKCI